MLLSRQAQQLQCIQRTLTLSTIQSTIANAAAINSSMYTQLLGVKDQRYVPYQPYIPPFIPSSVIELRQKTANVGNPMPPFMNCKGSQFITKWCNHFVSKRYKYRVHHEIIVSIISRADRVYLPVSQNDYKMIRFYNIWNKNKINFVWYIFLCIFFLKQKI